MDKMDKKRTKSTSNTRSKESVPKINHNQTKPPENKDSSQKIVSDLSVKKGSQTSTRKYDSKSYGTKAPENKDSSQKVSSDLSVNKGSQASTRKYDSKSYVRKPPRKTKVSSQKVLKPKFNERRSKQVEYHEPHDVRKNDQAKAPKIVPKLVKLYETGEEDNFNDVSQGERMHRHSLPKVRGSDRKKYDERSKDAAVIAYRRKSTKNLVPAKKNTKDVSEAGKEVCPALEMIDSISLLQNKPSESQSKVSLKKVDSSDVPEMKKISQEEIKSVAQSHSEEIKPSDRQEVCPDVREVKSIAQDKNKEVNSKESAEETKPSDGSECLKVFDIPDVPDEEEEEDFQLCVNSIPTQDDLPMNFPVVTSLYENRKYIEEESEKEAASEEIKISDVPEVKTKNTQQNENVEYLAAIQSCPDWQRETYEDEESPNQDAAEEMPHYESNEMDVYQIISKETQTPEQEPTSETLGIIYEPKVTRKSQAFPFNLKHGDNGNVLTVHHTVKEQDKLIRIRMAACCFNNRGSKFLAVDKRGNIFIFDLINKKYWRLWDQIPKATIIRQSLRANEYLIGTKSGHLVLVDIVQQNNPKTLGICAGSIENISFPGQPLQPSTLALVHAGTQAIIVNLNTFKTTHRLDFDNIRYSLKFACYVPNSEQIFTCFTNDAVHVWSSVTLNTLRVVYPIKTRDRRLKLMSQQSIPEISLTTQDQEYSLDEFQFNSQDQDFSNGLISAYDFSRDGSHLCLSTVDRHLLILDAHTYDMQRCIRLKDFTVTSCVFLLKPGETLLLVVTGFGHVLLLDCQRTEFKLIVHSAHARKLSISCDSKLLAVLVDSGEAYIWATGKVYSLLRSHQHCYQLMQTAFKEKKPLAVSCRENTAADVDLKKLLKPDRLLAILMEFGCYPAKYRGLIWSSLLQLPCNSCQFQQLVKMNIPCIIKQRAVNLKVKQEAYRRLLIKIWSCLSHWCKVFAYSEFFPGLIFPFIHVYPRNAIVIFEVCATLLLNHFQLWFEYHPLEPTNYLNMCSNVLQSFDKQLYSFYASLKITPKDYAWTLLSSAFSVVLDAEQWLCLWDHIISYPIYFPIFCAVAYNVQQREVVMRLPNADAVRQFFYEQNPVDIQKVIKKAYNMMVKCPAPVHPQRYIGNFTPIPKGVYVKFLNFPKKWVTQHEQELDTLNQEKYAMDARMRELEVEEHKMMERLENGLKAEEHMIRIKEMEALYQSTLKREEERLANQRKMLLLYQKEIRNRKGEALTALQESERRKKSIEMEREINALMHDINRQRQRNDSHLMAAEDELRNQNLELIAQKSKANCGQMPSLSQKFRQEIENVSRERNLLCDNFNELHRLRYNTASAVPVDNLEIIEKNVDEIYKEFINLTRTK